MRPILLLALTLAPFWSAPALAQDARLSGFARDLVTGSYSEAGHIDGLPVATVTMGAADVLLEETRLAEVAAVLGGNVQQAGEAGGRRLWLCYALADGGTLWLVSDGESGEGAATALALEAAPPPADAGCGPSPLTIAQVDFGAPAIGTSARDLAQRYGTFAVDAAGRVGFRSERPALVADELPTTQFLVYRLQAGRVAAVGVEQITGD